MRRALLLGVLAASSAQGAEVNGYADARTGYTRPRLDGLMPSGDVARFTELLEVNVQVKQPFLERSFAYGDLSLLTQFAGGYVGLDADGNEVSLSDHDVKTLHPVVSLNELYLSHEVRPWLNLLAGKKRVTWGSGMAHNPTDLLNPPKDPTDPNFQRAGAYLAMAELSTELLAFTLLGSPAVMKQESGIPYQFLAWPGWDRQDEQLHYQLAARAYALVENADVNLMLFYGNRYHDAFENKVRFGASFSRYFFTDYELHLEGLFQAGSARDFVSHDCVVDAAHAIACGLSGRAFVDKPLLDDTTILPRVLVGVRTQFSDESMLSLEYLYQADGYTREQFQDLVSGLDGLAQAKALGVPVNRLGGAGSLLGEGSGDGVPQKFSFEPTQRHYLFLTFQKPKIADDFTVSLVVMDNLQDLSGLVSPSVSWAAKEWLTLSLSGFIPFAGPKALAAVAPSSGRTFTEYSLMPLSYRGLFEARVFY
ncbi:MAG: hypothetical protein ACYC8T_33895 [Myxococcaceae bacterium]